MVPPVRERPPGQTAVVGQQRRPRPVGRTRCGDQLAGDRERPAVAAGSGSRRRPDHDRRAHLDRGVEHRRCRGPTGRSSAAPSSTADGPRRHRGRSAARPARSSPPPRHRAGPAGGRAPGTARPDRCSRRRRPEPNPQRAPPGTPRPVDEPSWLRNGGLPITRSNEPSPAPARHRAGRRPGFTWRPLAVGSTAAGRPGRPWPSGVDLDAPHAAHGCGRRRRSGRGPGCSSTAAIRRAAATRKLPVPHAGSSTRTAGHRTRPRRRPRREDRVEREVEQALHHVGRRVVRPEPLADPAIGQPLLVIVRDGGHRPQPGRPRTVGPDPPPPSLDASPVRVTRRPPPASGPCTSIGSPLWSHHDRRSADPFPTPSTRRPEEDATTLRRPRPAAGAARRARPPSATRSRRRSSARPSRRCSPGATCSARPPPAPARPRRSPCRSSSALAAAAPGRAHRPGPGADPRAGRCRCPRRSTATAATSAPEVLPIYGGQPIGRQLQALDRGVDVVVATPGRALDHIGRGTLPLDDVEVVVLDEADEMLDMGFAEDIEAILDATPDRPPDRAVLGHHAAAHRRASPSATCTTRSASRSARAADAAGRGAARSARPPTSSPAAHKPAALGRILDVEAPDRGHRLLPHPHRGRPAHRDAQRPRLPRRGAPRRHEPGAARPGHGPAARRHRRPARRHRRRRPRPRHRPAHPRRQLRRAVGARGLRAPHRPRRPGRPRGRGHHAGRAARAPPARQHRAAHQADDRDREGPDRRRPPRPPDGAHPRHAARGARRPTTSTAFRAVVDALADEFDARRRRARRGEARPRGQRRHRRRRGDPRHRHPREHRARATSGTRTARARRASAGTRASTARAQGQARTGATAARGRRGPQGDTSRLYVGAGRGDGVRPQDLVGAIAGETHLSGNDIGAIRISDRFALVEVPDATGRPGHRRHEAPPPSGARRPPSARTAATTIDSPPDCRHGSEPEQVAEVRPGQAQQRRQLQQRRARRARGGAAGRGRGQAVALERRRRAHARGDPGPHRVGGRGAAPPAPSAPANAAAPARADARHAPATPAEDSEAATRRRPMELDRASRGREVRLEAIRKELGVDPPA